MFNHQDLIENLSLEQKRALALKIKLEQERKKKEPLYKHKLNNNAQAALRGMDNRYRAITGGNKVGKTDECGWELVVICKGKAEEFGIAFPHKPPLKIWYCGRDRNVLSDEPLSSIKRYLKGEGIDYRTVWTGQTIQRMYIWDDNGNQSEIWFKPYNGEIGIFESSNVHAVFMDEEPPRDVFSAIKTKIAMLPGYVWLAMTPDKGLSWTYDLFEGTDPDHGNIVKSNALKKYQGSIFDNLLNFKIAQTKLWVRYPEEFIDIIQREGYVYRRNDEDILEVYAPDTMSFYLNDFVYGSNEYLMRALGRYVSFEGKVYFFQPFKVVNKVKVNWNVIDLHEVPDFSTMKFFGGLDYGKKDAFVYWIYGINKEDDMYILGEVYQTGLDAREQAKALKAINDHWGVVPEMIVADNQICNKLAQTDALKAHIQSIKDYYIDELGEHYTVWRTEEMDKRDPHIKRDHFDRKLKDGKVKFLRGHTEKSYNEISRLEYADGVKEKTKGRDDADAVARMVTGANISYENWLSSKDIKSIKAVDKNYQSTRIQKLVY
jgi:phage terminase large subunit-like protein